MTGTNDQLMRVDGLTKHYPRRGSGLGRRGEVIKSLDGVTFDVMRGETLGVVGESGCGKSTLARSLMRLHEVTSGRIEFDGRDITHLTQRQLRPIRKELMMVFQDPYGSLDPRQTVGSIIAEPLEIHTNLTPAAAKREVQSLLDRVGLNPEHVNRLPHEFSGGQRQRIGIARALAVRPKLIICDEPVSALDVSVQAQILNLLSDLQEEFGLTYVVIAHDLDVVRHVSDRVIVMYLGRIVEQGSKDQVYQRPRHPYTASLLDSVPVADPKAAKSRVPVVLEGEVPSPLHPPTGCHFHPRCPIAQSNCVVDDPPIVAREPGHLTACHYPLDKQRGGLRPAAAETPGPRSATS
jgi:oligopeptide/dipeptide ABC transporter ATP-binding protein